MAPILLSYAWPSLKELDFNGQFYFEDLRRVVGRFEKHVKLNWSGYLMDASWVEVLDFLRSRGPPTGTTLGYVNGSIAGAECEEMTRNEISFIFSEGDCIGGWWPESRATKYVLGWMAQNPVKDWENGELEMPQPTTEDEDEEGLGDNPLAAE